MRTERDSMGEMAVPDDALHGASTQRAVLNFPISGHRMPAGFIHALGLVKAACAQANEELGLLPPAKSRLIQAAAREVADGRHDAHFPVDIFQTGSGTSTNMNANEVIARRATQLAASAGDAAGTGEPAAGAAAGVDADAEAAPRIHPNDDVNLGQSSNDIIPTTLHVSVALALRRDLRSALEQLRTELAAKAQAFSAIVKIGRTHLMDAVPLTLGQEFSGYTAQVEKALARCDRATAALHELAVGGTAVGTGLNTHPEFAARVCRLLAGETGIAFTEAANHFEAQGARDDAVEVAGQLAAIAAALTKIANDLRLLGSGPRAGLGELRLPATQPGSSIMPGKVNPVMSEMLVQVGLHVQGLVTTAQLCGREGTLELNTTLPLLAHVLHEAIRCLAAGARQFATACVHGLEADQARCRDLCERSLMLVTALNPHIGYDAAASVAKEAFSTGKTLREVVLARGLLDAATLDRALDPAAMTSERQS